jgi:tRNA-binding protein
MEEITWQDFERVELRVGTVLHASRLENAKRPAYVLRIDFGPDIGMKKSSAQITDRYGEEELVGRQVIAVVNFPPKQIGSIMSECLVTGFRQNDGSVVLAIPDRLVDNGAKLV